MESIEKILSTLSDFIWGIPLVVLLLGTHIFLTFRLRFIQRFLPKAIKISLQRKGDGEGEISQFGSLVTALAATIGTGNIVGVATAIAAGGPGAVFWMWITGVFGIATKYSEALLSVKYREIDKETGVVSGGPMYVLKNGFKQKKLGKWLGILFALFTAVSAFGIGNMVQANSISTLAQDTFGLPYWITGIILAVFTASVIIGGVKSIARVCEVLVPFMAIFYFLGCVILLVINYVTVPDAIATIFNSAFSGHAAVGGFLGAGIKEVVRFGVARGLFSNESGLGSAPIIAAAAKTPDPVKQALVSSTATFWDTVVVCAVTGIVLVNSNEWINGLDGALLTKAAFSDIHIIGPIILTVSLLTFVFSTILGWSYYGEKAAEYILGKSVIKPYRWLWVVFVFIGSVLSLPIVWSLADITNGLMAIPNLISLLVLNKILVSETKKYLWEEK